MTSRQTPGAAPAPIAATLNTPTLGRAEAPQGRSPQSRSRTADHEACATPHADDITTGGRRHLNDSVETPHFVSKGATTTTRA